MLRRRTPIVAATRARCDVGAGFFSGSRPPLGSAVMCDHISSAADARVLKSSSQSALGAYQTGTRTFWMKITNLIIAVEGGATSRAVDDAERGERWARPEFAFRLRWS